MGSRLPTAFLAALGLAALAQASPAPQPPPREFMQQTVDEVLAVLRDPALTSEERRADLEKIAYARFDFRTMARLVLAKNWKRLSDAQRDEFVEEFTEYLANDYGSRIERYDQEEVEVLGEVPKPRGDVVVKTKILGGENSGALVDYRLRPHRGEWRIIDVVIEGISLVANFRDQFREVMGREGPEAMLAKLRQKNADGSHSGSENGVVLPAGDIGS
jgi:phospholipid transport system substrate-binding protein